MPAVLFKIIGLPNDISSIVLLNFFLETLACYFLFNFLQKVIISLEISRSNAVICALSGVAIQIFACEPLLSFGLVYWCQEIFQLIFIIYLNVLFDYLGDAKSSRFTIFFFAVLTVVAPLVEWTGFVLNVGVFCVLIARARYDSRARLAISLARIGSLLAMLLLLGHLSATLGLEQAIAALRARFLARSSKSGSLLTLLKGYLISFGLILPIALLLLLPCIAIFRRLPQDGERVLLVFASAVFACIENLILLQHASEFSFDRLKLAVPIAMIIALGLSQISTISFRFAIVALLIAFTENTAVYEWLLFTHSSWERIDADNKALAMRVEQIIDIRCVDFDTNVAVRGYATLLFHRNIYENIPKSLFLSGAAGGSPKSCGRVYLQGESSFSDLPHFSEAFIEGPVSMHIVLQ